jgi:hypothetical protein
LGFFVGRDAAPAPRGLWLFCFDFPTHQAAKPAPNRLDRVLPGGFNQFCVTPAGFHFPDKFPRKVAAANSSERHCHVFARVPIDNPGSDRGSPQLAVSDINECIPAIPSS